MPFTPTLLIADDDPIVRALLEVQLRAHFRLVGPACDATEAIALAGEHQPDVALIDVNMPGGGAQEAIPRIASCSTGTRLVALSASEPGDVSAGLLELGAVAYIQKGLAGSEIAKKLLEVLSTTDSVGGSPGRRPIGVGMTSRVET